MEKLIAYYRVSTEKQGQSKLGLEAQRASVAQFAASIGATVEAHFTEVESGKRADRPQLAKAIAHARRSKAKLCIAKLDRLARNVAFVSALMETGIDFLAVDNATANKLTIHIMAAVAEDEARRISERTKAALGAAKARGTLLGSARPDHWEGREDARLAGLDKARAAARIAKRKNAIAAVSDLLPDIQARRSAGESLAAIATALNDAGQLTTRGKQWSATQVMRAIDRASSN